MSDSFNINLVITFASSRSEVYNEGKGMHTHTLTQMNALQCHAMPCDGLSII